MTGQRHDNDFVLLCTEYRAKLDASRYQAFADSLFWLRFDSKRLVGCGLVSHGNAEFTEYIDVTVHKVLQAT